MNRMFQTLHRLAAILLLMSTLPVGAQEETVPMPVPTQSNHPADAGRSVNAGRQINAANELMRDRDFEAAVKQYAAIEAGPPHRDVLNYNLAVAKYRLGDIAESAELFAKTAAADDARTAAGSRYNLGNCRYALALQTAKQDRPAAIEQLREAIAAYRSSLRLQADNTDARANIELAAELIRQLEEQQKEEQQKEEQQKDQQQKDQQQKDQQQKDQQQGQKNQQESSDDSNDQDESQQQSEDSSSQDNRNQGQQQNDQPQNPSEQQSDDSQPDKQGQETPKDQKPNGSPSQSDQDNQNQQQSQQRAGWPDDQQTRDETPPSTGEEQEAKAIPEGQLTSKADDSKRPGDRVGVAGEKALDKPMTKQEAMKMLQAVRDRDMLRRFRRQQQERSRRVPIDRDW